MNRNPKRKVFVTNIDNPDTNINFIELDKTKLSLTKVTRSKTYISVQTHIPLPKKAIEISKIRKWVVITQIGKFRIKQSLETHKLAIFYEDEFISMIYEDDTRNYARLLYHIFDSYSIKSKTIIVNGIKVKVKIERT